MVQCFFFCSFLNQYSHHTYTLIQTLSRKHRTSVQLLEHSKQLRLLICTMKRGKEEDENLCVLKNRLCQTHTKSSHLAALQSSRCAQTSGQREIKRSFRALHRTSLSHCLKNNRKCDFDYQSRKQSPITRFSHYVGRR